MSVELTPEQEKQMQEREKIDVAMAWVLKK